MKKFKKINPIQYGGIKGHSTILQLIRTIELVNVERHKLQEMVYYALKSNTNEVGKKILMVHRNKILLYFADITKAFDSFGRINAISELEKAGIGGKLLQQIGGYYTIRRQQVMVNNKKSKIIDTLMVVHSVIP